MCVVHLSNLCPSIFILFTSIVMAAPSLCASSLNIISFTVAFNGFSAHMLQIREQSGQGSQDQAAEVMNIISFL